MIYFHTYTNPGLIIDLVQGLQSILMILVAIKIVLLNFSLAMLTITFNTDIRRLNRQALRAVHSGMIILGGGVTKHHVCNANLMVSLTFKIVKCWFSFQFNFDTELPKHITEKTFILYTCDLEHSDCEGEICHIVVGSL